MNSPNVVSEPPKSLRGVSESFRQRADSAAFYEAWVGAVLTRCGLYVKLNPWEIDGKDHSVDFDLVVSVDEEYLWGPGKHCGAIEVEVKSVELRFTNSKDYPYRDMFVCSQASWLRKWPGKDSVQRDFLFVSRPTGNVVWLPRGCPVTLGVEAFDRSRGHGHKTVTADSGALRELSDFVHMVKSHG